MSVDTLFELEQVDDLERRIRIVVAEFYKQPGWPRDEARDRAFAQELIKTFPRLNLPAELLAFREWLADYKPKPGRKVNHRARFATWCNRTRTRPAGRRPTGMAGNSAAGGRTRTAPCDPADFDGLASSL